MTPINRHPCVLTRRRISCTNHWATTARNTGHPRRITTQWGCATGRSRPSAAVPQINHDPVRMRTRAKTPKKLFDIQKRTRPRTRKQKSMTKSFPVLFFYAPTSEVGTVLAIPPRSLNRHRGLMAITLEEIGPHGLLGSK